MRRVTWWAWLLLTVGALGAQAVPATIASDLPAYQVGSVGMAPMRTLIDWLDASTEWRAETRTLHLLARTPAGSRRISLVGGGLEARVNGEPFALPRAPFMAHGGFYAPVRPVLEALGVESTWSAEPRGLSLKLGEREGFLAFMPAVYPLVNRWGVLLGGRLADSWVDDKAMAAKLNGGERYWAWTPAAALDLKLTGTKPHEEQPGEYQAVELGWPDSVHPKAVAFGGPWDLQPRLARQLATANSLYLPMVAEVLAEHGLPKAKPVLRQAMIVDLEGDGQDEVLLAASSMDPAMPPPEAKAGDYAMVLLRRLEGDAVKTHLLEGTFHTKVGAAAHVATISSLLDLDGDGTLEILLDWRYYEGAGTDVYQLKDGKPVPVIGSGMGA